MSFVFFLFCFMWQAVELCVEFSSEKLKGVRGARGVRRREEIQEGCHMPVNTPITAISPEMVRGDRGSITMTTPIP